MNTIRHIIGAMVLVAAVAQSAFSADVDMPKMRIVKIKEPVTRQIIDILPGRGVKCIFPWVLDEQAGVMPARIVITNDAVFEKNRGDDQNAIEFKIKAKSTEIEGEVCDAFVSVEGFHFNFTLRANFSKRAHYSTILFELTEAQKYELINDAIRQRRKQLEKEYKADGPGSGEANDPQTLKMVARTVLRRPKKTNVYEKNAMRLDNGDRIIFLADQIKSYSDIHILQISVENDSRRDPLYINAIQIEKTSGNTQPLFSDFEIAGRIDAGQSADGFVVTRDPRIIEKHDTRIKLLTDKGEVVLKW